MRTANRTILGSKTEELLGDRKGDRALRLSDLGTVVAENTLKVLANAGISAGSGGPSGTGGELDMGDRIASGAVFDGGARV